MKFNEALLDQIRKNDSTLTRIHLGFNKIYDAGAKTLSKALKRNSCLTSIYLEGNNIGNDGAMALSEVLKSNSSITTMDLTLNKISGIGISALSEALKFNYTLLELKGVSDPAITRYLKRNNTIPDYLKPLDDFNQNQAVGLKGEVIKNGLEKLQQLVPALNSQEEALDDENYLAECYRLLTALGHVTNSGSEVDALQCLLPDFD